ncbi:uncharacterized protein LOC128961500 [Oppia nitens]|uniref:uncharacterized protein LOC128961500 n=1 Tax=Oppia nitens TaxID=1686743 RepID=UPI0023DBAC47|nr:uncharacterized protein LOC128961500 [Oppia nitens]
MAKNVPIRGLGIGVGSLNINETHIKDEPVCHPSQSTEVVILLTIASIGCLTNLLLMLLVLIRKPFKRYHKSWSQGLLLHQGLVDLGRALLIIPLAISVMQCQRLTRCSIIDSVFLLLVTVSTVNMLTCLINDAPIFPEHEQLGRVLGSIQHQPREYYWLETSGQNPNNIDLRNDDSPYCIVFAVFIIWFASLTINLGPTLLSGALASGTDTTGHLNICPMVYRPVRHYVLDLLWISVNLMCVMLMAIHLRKLYKDIVKSNLEAIHVSSLVTTMMTVQTDREQDDQRNFYNYVQRLENEGISRVKMFVIILIAYLLFWGPLYIITITQPGLETSLTYEICLHVALTHCIVNPILFMVYSRGNSDSDPNNQESDRQGCCCKCMAYVCCSNADTPTTSPSSPTVSPNLDPNAVSPMMLFFSIGNNHVNPSAHQMTTTCANHTTNSINFNSTNKRMETTI